MTEGVDPMEAVESTHTTHDGYERLPVTSVCLTEGCRAKGILVKLSLDISHGPSDSLGVICGWCKQEPSIQII